MVKGNIQPSTHIFQAMGFRYDSAKQEGLGTISIPAIRMVNCLESVSLRVNRHNQAYVTAIWAQRQHEY